MAEFRGVMDKRASKTVRLRAQHVKLKLNKLEPLVMNIDSIHA